MENTQETQEIQIQHRKDCLVSELKNYGLSLRTDSRLCYCYIHGKLGNEWDLKRVVNECCIMHWLYMYTDYPIRCQLAYRYFSNIFINSSTVHEYIKYNIQPYIKSEIISSMGGIPIVWPWMTNKTDKTETETDVIT